jgi:hypothetical protein
MNNNITNNDTRETNSLKNRANTKVEYSKEIIDKISRICEFYEKYNGFKIHQKIAMFMAEVVRYHIPDKYYVTSKKHIEFYLQKALQIWEKDGSAEELDKVKIEYINSINREKPLEKVLKNKKENAAMNCVVGILYNGRADLTNQFVYDFLELFVNDCEVLDIREQYISELLDKYFSHLS